MIREMKGGDDLIMKFNKRGLSGVVTTVIIILLVLAAVAIIWAAIRPAIQSGAEQIGPQTQCFNLELEVTNCEVDSNGNLLVTVSRGGDSMDLSEIRVATGEGDSEDSTAPVALASTIVTVASDVGSYAGGDDVTFTLGGIQSEGGGVCQSVESPQTVTCVAAS